MAPPVIQQPGSNSVNHKSPSSQSRPQRPHEKKQDLICRVKWNNQLPDIPFDPKFITYPFENGRFVKYKQTSLERSYKHDLVTEHDLGVTIDLINPETYVAPPNAVLYPEDDKLLEEDIGMSGHTAKDEKRSKQHNKVVPWLKKTEYIATEFNRYGASSEKSETKVGYNVRKKFANDQLYLDRESQIEQINKTFEEAKKPITTYHHAHKKDVTPVQIYPVFPDFENWKYPFAQVNFDAEPISSTQAAKKPEEGQKPDDGQKPEAGKSMIAEGTNEEMSEAMIRGMMDDRGEQFVAYFLPTAETLEKRKNDAEADPPQDYDPSGEYDYKMAREYNWNVKNKQGRGYEENYFFLMRDDCIYYNELETKVRLSKRRTKAGPANNSRLIVRHRALTDQELRTQENRMTALMPADDEQDKQQEEEAQRSQDEDQLPNTSQERDGDADEDSSPRKKQKKRKISSGSDSGSSSSDSSSGSSSGSSDSESEDEDKKKRVKKAEEEIFGSDDSD